MSTTDFLRDTLTGVASQRYSVDQAIARILSEYPRIDDHAGEPGHWNTADQYGNIDGPFDSYDDAIDNAPGGASPYWVDAEDDDDSED